MRQVIAFVFIMSAMLMMGTLIACTEDTEPTSSTVEMKTVTLSVEKMTCKMCHITVQSALDELIDACKSDQPSKQCALIETLSKKGFLKD